MEEVVKEIKNLYKYLKFCSDFVVTGHLPPDKNNGSKLVYIDDDILENLGTLDDIDINKVQKYAERCFNIYQKTWRNTYENIQFPRIIIDKLLNTEEFVIETNGINNEQTAALGTIIVGLWDKDSIIKIHHGNETRTIQLNKYDWCFFYDNCTYEIKGEPTYLIYKVRGSITCNWDCKELLTHVTQPKEEKIKNIVQKVVQLNELVQADEDCCIECIIFECVHDYPINCRTGFRNIDRNSLKEEDEMLFNELQKYFDKRITCGVLTLDEGFIDAGIEEYEDDTARFLCTFTEGINKWPQDENDYQEVELYKPVITVNF